MRKLKLQMQMTINGYVGGPDGKNDWMTWNPDDEFLAFLAALIDSSGTLLLGRKTAEGIIPYWEDTAEKNPAHPFAKKIVDIPKVVFTKTLGKSIWKNTALAKGNLAEGIANLKKRLNIIKKMFLIFCVSKIFRVSNSYNCYCLCRSEILKIINKLKSSINKM